jgi:hypothetical protein
MFKTGDPISGTFPVSDPATGGLIAADSPPTAELRINGTASAAVVTVGATATAGKYTWSVTLPEVSDGQVLEVWVEAAVETVVGGGVVWSGEGCTKRPADVPADTKAALEAEGTTLASLLQLARGQRVIDQTTTPWQLVLKDRDSGAEILRFDLKDEAGNGIDSIETFIAEQTTPV